jgi:hypothetical protein
MPTWIRRTLVSVISILVPSCGGGAMSPSTAVNLTGHVVRCHRPRVGGRPCAARDVDGDAGRQHGIRPRVGAHITSGNGRRLLRHHDRQHCGRPSFFHALRAAAARVGLLAVGHRIRGSFNQHARGEPERSIHVVRRSRAAVEQSNRFGKAIDRAGSETIG